MTIELRADCSRCAGLCCVAPAFGRSSDFAIDKPAGQACPNLGADFRCGIHTRLRRSGFAGCAVFDCFGAGQHLTQGTLAGRTWRDEPRDAPRMFAAFHAMRNLHELLYYLTEALSLPAAAGLHAELREAHDGIAALTAGTADELIAVDAAPLRAGVGELLERVSELVRAEGGARGRGGVARGAGGAGARGGGRAANGRRSPGGAKLDRRGADLVGAVLTGTDLRGANLRGAYLMGADLTRADLRGADLLGTDLRGADLAGADLSGAVFLTQSQLEAAVGDRSTRLPVGRVRPAHWPTAKGA